MRLHSVVSIPRIAALLVDSDQADTPSLEEPVEVCPGGESTEPERSTRCSDGDGQSARLAA